MSRIISLSKGLTTIVDDEDFSFLIRFSWCARKCVDRDYAITARKWNGIYHATFMHRLILNAPPNMVVDHIDADTLNNRKENLRICTQGENSSSRRPNKGRRFKGVRITTNAERFAAGIWTRNRNIYLGTFGSREEAARAYDAKAIELFGEFAKLNFPKEYLTSEPTTESVKAQTLTQ